MEEVVTSAAAAQLFRGAYGRKRVLLTGHTGFKGGWLALWLRELGADITGFALPPDTNPSLFEAARVGEALKSIEGDVRDVAQVRKALAQAEPDVVFHLAAQPLVRKSYQEPLETIQSNVLGTANLLEAVRLAGKPCSVVVVTSDKCYENRNWVHGYREDDAMGGHDVYSMSKGAAELVTSSYRRSFFAPDKLQQHGIAVASARAGNVIGGGDWCADRIVPDAVRALSEGKSIPVRNPDSVRPWQHVLEPLGGYLLLGARLAQGPAAKRAGYCGPWNFGPRLEDAQPVRRMVDLLLEGWGSGRWEDKRDPSAPHEASLLRLACEKAHAQMGWLPRWDLRKATARTADWYSTWYRKRPGNGMRAFCVEQIRAYEES